MDNTTNTCPRCGGAGELFLPDQEGGEYAVGGNGYHDECSLCKGTGAITDKQYNVYYGLRAERDADNLGGTGHGDISYSDADPGL